MMRWVLIVVGVLVALAASIYGLGMSTPRHHLAEVEGVVSRPVADVAATIRAVENYSAWRSGVVVEKIARTEGAVTYVEVADGDRIAYRLTEPERDARFVSTITDETLPFGGAWTVSLTSEGASTRVRIREEGDVRDPLYRFFARYVFGHTSTMKTYLKNLGAAPAEVASPPG
ncbi:MAG: SRPBCC family protein [Hyphomonadaceae bacterium]|nr:MAG: hypothetical protein FD160_1911 [Caulobacteraceae bacterium]MBT9446404.1 SRPBCC family protein [Hyphomonadaceae bacterium]TPW04925.1 MAG: hypothetical protein FD124_2388 [Alphaproteobacteria bacterium]